MDGGLLVSRTEVKQQASVPQVCPSLELLNAAVIFLSTSEEVRFYNVAACKLFDHAELLAPPVPLRECLTSQSDEYQMLAHCVREQRILRDTIVTWERNGQLLYLLLDSFPFLSESGDYLGLFITMKDLGDFGVLDQHLQRAEKLATIGKVAAGIAHEIRNPLTTVKGFLQILESRQEASGREDEHSLTEMMLSEIQKVDELVQELLLLARPHHLDMEFFCMSDLIEELRGHVVSEADRMGIESHFEIEDKLFLQADRQMILRLLHHLIKNALEAMDAGGKLTVLVKNQSPWCEMYISDTGPGIPYYQIDKIFDAFYTTKEKGTGLGLPICQRIVADHGGDIRVSSKGFGSTFCVRLPLAKEEIIPSA